MPAGQSGGVEEQTRVVPAVVSGVASSRECLVSRLFFARLAFEFVYCAASRNLRVRTSLDLEKHMRLEIEYASTLQLSKLVFAMVLMEKFKR
ncbi:unnamed protein product, partial [Brenthis ino]